MSITLNDNILTSAPKHVDARYAKFSGGVQVPYTDIAEANTTVISSRRTKYLTVLILQDGVPTEYWWRNGIADGDLEPKSIQRATTAGSTASFTVKAGHDHEDTIIVPPSNLGNVRMGTTLNGNDLVPGIAVDAPDGGSIGGGGYCHSNKTFYLSGLVAGTIIIVKQKFLL